MERSGPLGADMNRRPALKERQMLAVFFARALGWESNRLDTRSPVSERLPLFRVCLASAYVQGNVVGADLRAGRFLACTVTLLGRLGDPPLPTPNTIGTMSNVAMLHYATL